MYPHDFPPTPQPLAQVAFLSLDLGSFRCPRWERPVDLVALKVTSLIAAAQAMQV